MLFCFIAVYAKVYDLDESNDVYIAGGSSVQFAISSNPTTGFSWYIVSSSLGVVQTEDLDGEYTAYKTGLLGSGGYQTFTLTCTNLCQKHSHTSVSLEYKQPWVGVPVDTREVMIHISS